MAIGRLLLPWVCIEVVLLLLSVNTASPRDYRSIHAQLVACCICCGWFQKHPDCCDGANIYDWQ